VKDGGDGDALELFRPGRQQRETDLDRRGRRENRGDTEGRIPPKSLATELAAMDLRVESSVSGLVAKLRRHRHAG